MNPRQSCGFSGTSPDFFVLLPRQRTPNERTFLPPKLNIYRWWFLVLDLANTPFLLWNLPMGILKTKMKGNRWDRSFSSTRLYYATYNNSTSKRSQLVTFLVNVILHICWIRCRAKPWSVIRKKKKLHKVHCHYCASEHEF